jgi:hypothetical protein
MVHWEDLVQLRLPLYRLLPSVEREQDCTAQGCCRTWGCLWLTQSRVTDGPCSRLIGPIFSLKTFSLALVLIQRSIVWYNGMVYSIPLQTIKL